MKQTYQHLLLKALGRIQFGEITIKLPDGSHHFVGSRNSGPQVELIIHNQDFFRRVVLHDDIGLGESYMLGEWEIDDLAALLKLLILNRNHLGNPAARPFIGILKKLVVSIDTLMHRTRSNTKQQSRKNIHAHYDLGNDFYQLFLDNSMTYSSGFFTDSGKDLEAAQFEKYDRLCRKLNLKPGHELLEIGSGWGGFAMHAAKHYECKVTTVTISERQHAYAKERIEAAGLQGQIDLRLQDYRDITGQFDRIASIEMLEAVGHEHLDSYFRQCQSLLKPNGILAIQVILSPDSRYKDYRTGVDFIRKHIFPGGHLPSIESIHKVVRKRTDWDLQHMETFGTHYAETLRQWRNQFNASAHKREALGFDEAFDRKWNFYFAYCEAGFDARHIQVGQLVFASPNTTDYQFENLQEQRTDLAPSAETHSPKIQKQQRGSA